MININADFKGNRTEVTGDEPTSLDYVLAIYSAILALSETEELTLDDAKLYIMEKIKVLDKLNKTEENPND